MKHILPLLIPLCMLAQSCASVAVKADPKKPVGVTIEELVDQVQGAVASANEKLQNNKALPPLDSIELNLKVAETRDVNGKINLLVVTIGGDYSKAIVREYRIKLDPTAPAKVASVSLGQALEQQILDVAQGLQNVGAGKLPLAAKEVDVSISFEVESSGQGGIKIEIAPVGIEAGGSNKRALAQEIKVS